MIEKRIKYCLTIAIACLFSNLYAGGITVRQIPVTKQLPSNTVYRMFQDRDGFVWLGTQNGFCRYDGYDMKSFRSEITNPTFQSNFITGGFAEDTINHRLWIGTEKGVLILDKHTYTITSLDTALLGNSPIRQILYADNAIWVCSDYGLYLYNLDKSLRKKYMGGTSSIHIDDKGVVRVTGWRNGMYYLDKATDTFLPYPPIGPTNNPHKLFEDREGRFWICTWGDGLFRFYPDRQGQAMYEYVNLPDDKKFSLNIYYSIEQDDVNNYLWVLSYAGVTVFTLKGDSVAPVKEFASPINDVTNLFSDFMKDRDGNLWLGTFNQGALVVNPSRSSVTNLDLQFIKAKTGYLPNIVNVFEDKEGELWLKQSRIGMFLLNPRTSELRRLEMPDINAANAFCYHSETGEIWIAVDYVPTIYRLRKSNGKVTLTGTINMRDILGENRPDITEIVRFLHEDKNGTLWVATTNILLSLKNGKWQIINDNCGTITGMIEDSYGNSWLGTEENGLLQLVRDGDKINIKTYNANGGQLPGNNISCISAGADGKLWFCLNEKQLYCYDINKQQFTNYSPKANVNNLVIYNIIAATNGYIWISSDKQIIEFNPLTGASIQYDAQDDLIITSLNKNSIAQTSDSSILFGGNRGLCIFTSSPQVEMPCKNVKTAITNIKINGKPINQNGIKRKSPDWQKELVLLPNETNLEIDFSSFNYLNPGKTRYAYKLEGIDKQWMYVEPGRNFAVYNQLKKGKYPFLVKSTEDNQLWSDEITRLVIIREPAYYETGWAYTAYAVIAVLILFAALRYYVNRVQWQTQLHMAQMDMEKTEELIQTKLRFFTNIGHEFRTPLTLIMTPLSRLIHQLTDNDLKQKLVPIYRNAEDLLGLINQLLDFRKMEMGGEKLKLSCDDFVKFVEYIYLTFKDVAAIKSIQFIFESDVKQLLMSFDKNKVQKIINNLYSNALKFTPEEGYIATSIRLVHEEEREFVRLDIADSGCGIPDKEQQSIFERFYQSENSYPGKTGTGIGLHLAKEYVTLHSGRIAVSSKVGEGSVFSIFIPTDLKISDDENLENQVEPLRTKALPHATSLPDHSESGKNQEQKTLLIVEDNAELRHFLAEQLGEKFTVLQAADGQEGLLIAQKKFPDLIISDLIMPVLSGLEMCQQLKNDISTSHISIILLTAKISNETEIESYKAGADSYIAKPFNFDVLLTRIETLIEQQEKRRKLFHKTIEITPSSITASSLDEELIKKALIAVEKNIDKSEYSVDELASELAISRRQLSRKFHSIIGLSPGEFIRSVRLKRAAQLLKNTQYNISEIAYMVGFNAVKYFNLNFKDEFGVTPSQYRAEGVKA